MAADIQRERARQQLQRGKNIVDPSPSVDHFLKSAASERVSGRSGETADERESKEKGENEKRMC